MRLLTRRKSARGMTPQSADPSANSIAVPDDGPPRAVRVAVGALLTALATGIVETIAQLWPLDALGDSLSAITIRLLIYTAVLVAVVSFARGRNGAQLALLLGLGVVGMLSLLIDPVIWILTDPDLGAFLAAMDARLAVITGSRVAHIAAVIVAVVAMTRPSTRRYCSQAVNAPRRFTRPPRGEQ